MLRRPEPPSVTIHVPDADTCVSARLDRARGDLLAGEVRVAAQGFARVQDATPARQVTALAGLVECRLALGDVPGAAAALDRTAPLLRRTRGRGGSGRAPGARAAYAGGLLALATDDPAEALIRFRSAGEAAAGVLDEDPALMPWRAEAALACLRAASIEGACELAGDHLEVSRRHGSAAGAAQALRALAVADVEGRRLELLREAHGALRGTTARRLEAQIDADLAAVLLLHGEPVGTATNDEAVGRLLGVEQYARSEGLAPLHERARRLLAIAPGTSPVPSWSALEQLSPAERRVADLAGAGETNRAIAEQLEISIKAVEWHLSRTYRRLGIGSRRELAALTGAATAPPRIATG